MTGRIKNVVDFPTAGARAQRRSEMRGRDPDALIEVLEFRLAELESEMDAALMLRDLDAARSWAQTWAFLTVRRRELRALAVDARMAEVRALSTCG